MSTQPVYNEAPSGGRALAAFTRLKEAYHRDPYIDYATRRRTLKTIERILLENDDALCEAISGDFGNRSYHESRILEIAPTVMGIRYTLKRLKRWMKPQKRHVSILFMGGKNSVIPQAKGVAGIISPWNYPLQLALSPMTSAIAAGNRVMLKMATNSQGLCRLLHTLFTEKIPEEIVTILPGIGANEFSTLPFDHMVFTGSPGVGRTIMSNASHHLTPVTLELGGKSPTILDNRYAIRTAAARIMYAKLINSGQTCVAPDYLFIPEGRVHQFIGACRSIVQNRYPDIMTKDYTCIIDQKSFERLRSTLEDARRRNADIIKLLPGDDFNEGGRKICPMIITNVTGEMRIMQNEIFGPLLPIITYRHPEEVIEYINRHERPLALYIYSNSRKFQRTILQNTLSGGVTINDSAMHVAQHDIPFGGIGNSGMGQYHAYEGFLEMSKLRPVFRQSSMAISVAPPYGTAFDRIYGLVKRIRWLS
ncbi:MAG: coniferyl aldehyde dehydrogenase [Spirochaetes bacterium]|nr:coniferyl aldehyde dehydrogenase [Spirochaetota bacterium]